ncbi:MAG: hypothetical protein AAFX10_14260, partial [Pseudomonadota bacterium]
MNLPAIRMRWLVLVCLVSGTAGAANAPGSKSIGISRTAQGPVIDGVLSDAEWDSAVIIDDLHQTIPIEYDEPSQRTEFLLQYDDDALYIGVRA